MQQAGTTESKRSRRSDIDLLRVVACFIGIPFHTALIFSFYPLYHLKDEERSLGLTIFADFLHQWRMPLFFLVAGWSALAVLGRRTNGA